jgi:pimeloyl-ACP methyl ester carboxylesterase
VASGPPGPPPRTVRFALAFDGHAAGNEVWNITESADGSQTIDFESVVETPRGKVGGKGRYSLDAAHLPEAAEVSIRTPDETDAKFRLTRTGLDLSMTMERGGKSDELKAGRPSNVFVPRPFFVGLSPLCALLREKDPPPLVEFPGSAISVLGVKTVTGAVVFALDHGGMGRTLIACDGSDVVAVLDPWSGQSATRSDHADIGEALSKSVERVKPAIPADLTEEEVSVAVPADGADEAAKLACSFLRPTRAPAKLPAVIFSTGSGPQDRDEDSEGRGGLKLSIFKVMAIALAEKGVASLRCDDRGTGKSTGTFEKATLGTFVRDAVQTLAELAKRPGVDATRLGFVGHSEGAVVGPLVATQSGKVRALLLMASPGRPLPEIGMIQEEALLKQSGLPPDQIAKQLSAQRAVVDAIRDGKPLPDSLAPEQKAEVEKQRAWLKSHFDNDIQVSLGRVPKMPIFIVQGGKDFQVPPEDADLVRKGLALGKNPQAKVTIYPELNHLFAASHGGGLMEYSEVDAHIDEGFLADTVDFFVHALVK